MTGQRSRLGNGAHIAAALLPALCAAIQSTSRAALNYRFTDKLRLFARAQQSAGDVFATTPNSDADFAYLQLQVKY